MRVLPKVMLTIGNTCNRHQGKRNHSASIFERMVHADRTQNTNGSFHVDMTEDARWPESAIREFNRLYPRQN